MWKWCLSYKSTCHVILQAKLHDMYLYKTATFLHQSIKSISKVAFLHRFHCSLSIDHSKAVSLLQLFFFLWVCGFIYCVCFVKICSYFWLLFVIVALSTTTVANAPHALWKHAYSNILKIVPQKKNENFQIKNCNIFYISAQSIDCGYLLKPPCQGGSNGYPQSFWAEIRKIMYTPENPSFSILKWGLRGQNYIGMFSWWLYKLYLVNYFLHYLFY